ncbi:hypothetical protein, partial [Marinagarivorans algicola]|uniref:hypothetical protein n=1 Tax=Marinagarivorans algicola TaxID=1513270 RepID=UPI0009E8AF55
MNNSVITFFIVLIGFSSSANSIILSEAIISRGKDTIRSNVAKAVSPIITSIVNANGGKPGLGLAYTNMNAGDAWYRLYDNMQLFSVNPASHSLIGAWYLETAPICTESDVDCHEPWWYGRWGDQEVLEIEFIERVYNHDISLRFDMPQKNKLAECLGCLTQTPMRYGDMTGDGAPEIVLFLGDSMVIFSTKLHKVIFSTLLDLDDAMPWQDQIDAGLILDPNDKASPQYGSKVLYENVNSTSIGYRGYAKIYLDDFNNDTRRDIVMWRKFYQSRLKNDATPGFEKVRDTWVHYSLDGGEYKLQATDSAT